MHDVFLPRCRAILPRDSCDSGVVIQLCLFKIQVGKAHLELKHVGTCPSCMQMSILLLLLGSEVKTWTCRLHRTLSQSWSMKSLTIGQKGGRPAHAFANILATPNVVFYSINRRAVIFDRSFISSLAGPYFTFVHRQKK
jgi:hypothetical protein